MPTVNKITKNPLHKPINNSDTSPSKKYTKQNFRFPENVMSRRPEQTIWQNIRMTAVDTLTARTVEVGWLSSRPVSLAQTRVV